MSSQKVDLFTPYEMGIFSLKNRMVMAPLTRSRAEDGNIPTKMAIAYYSARAGAGMIITEATQISAGAQGYVSTPGVYSPEQVERWKMVTDEVHREGGVIFLQLWHVGRISHPDFRNGELPVAPSAVAPRGMSTYTPTGMKPIPTPRALEIEEIRAIVEDYRQAAKNARAAGFDGVEVHGANGYLLDQFLQDCTNLRTDQYGGSVENRARMLFEVVDAVASEIGRERVGVRLSPGGTFNDMMDCNPEQTFDYAVENLGRRDLAYLHLIEPARPVGEHPTPDLSARRFRPLYPGTIIVAGGYTLERANAVLEEGVADLVAFGQLFLANPDLPERFRRGAKLNKPDAETFYTPGAKGYIDYPTLEEAAV
jgi:N-ethylmaleimide reductase